MTALPPAPYPDGLPEESARIWLEQGVRGEAKISRSSDGDSAFHTAHWLVRHGTAIAARTDFGAFRVWGALLADGRRVHCRRSIIPGSAHYPGLWRRRSDDGRSWAVGVARFAADEIFFDEGLSYRASQELDGNAFERAMADQPGFRAALRDDSFAATFNYDLWVEALCTLDGEIGWYPSRADAADTIARLRDLGENWFDFKHGGPWPEPPPTDRAIILAELAKAGWRYQTDDDARRLNPEIMRR